MTTSFAAAANFSTPPVSPPAFSVLRRAAAAHPHPLLFLTISGAHLYGFPSPDSDWDLRGAHILPAARLLGLDLSPPEETLSDSRFSEGLEIDSVTHDVRKFFNLLLRKNGYVLEQIHSPLVVHTTPEHNELKHLARACVTPHHAHHYLGFADTQWKLFLGENPPRVKPLLYVYRVLLTGLWLLRTGEIEANLANLNETFRIPGLVDLMARKTAGAEQSALDDANSLSHHETQYNRLRDELLAARETNPARLPEAPSAETRAALNALLLRLRS